ncbi:hypothetical protein FPV67DRAFT_1454676 [Lyophyllum atratum]|nr:hypothetical protein FPV67DRAFT_1454676 [Lyophyllum atratum]
MANHDGGLDAVHLGLRLGLGDNDFGRRRRFLDSEVSHYWAVWDASMTHQICVGQDLSFAPKRKLPPNFHHYHHHTSIQCMMDLGNLTLSLEHPSIEHIGQRRSLPHSYCMLGPNTAIIDIPNYRLRYHDFGLNGDSSYVKDLQRYNILVQKEEREALKLLETKRSLAKAEIDASWTTRLPTAITSFMASKVGSRVRQRTTTGGGSSVPIPGSVAAVKQKFIATLRLAVARHEHSHLLASIDRVAMELEILKAEAKVIPTTNVESVERQVEAEKRSENLTKEGFIGIGGMKTSVENSLGPGLTQAEQRDIVQALRLAHSNQGT